MPAVTAETLLPLCKDILLKEGYNLDDQRMLGVLRHVDGDIRKVLQSLDELIN